MSIICTSCSRVFRVARAALSLVLRRTYEVVRPFSCPHCGFRYEKHYTVATTEDD